MDAFQARAINSLRKRHEDKIRQDAKQIQEYIGYLLTRLDSGNVTSVTHLAAGIAADAQEIVIRLAALEAAAEATAILETAED